MNLMWVMEFIGTFAFAISGLRLAAAKNFDWYGAYVVGLAVAIGGGTIRDVLLNTTPFWMTNPIYLIITGVALIYTVVFAKYVVRMKSAFFIFDTVGLALYAVVGVEKTLSFGFPLWVATGMGLLTATAGGVLRDILINEIPLIFRKELYATLCILGGLVFGLCQKLGLDILWTEVISFLVIFISRILSVRYHIALPKIKSKVGESAMDDFE
ncbi:MAG: trimeric intracellular cation channel family protein [Marinifilaceae bacterium]|nr:trimeric intracellular cation channel family protein [Marinifilaceae bacterium]